MVNLISGLFKVDFVIFSRFFRKTLQKYIYLGIRSKTRPILARIYLRMYLGMSIYKD